MAIYGIQLQTCQHEMNQPRSHALPSCLRKDPGWGWSRVTRISRGKLKLSLG